MFFTTAYTSQMTKLLDDSELEELLRTSRSRNAARQITGLLLYREGHVLQMLEGPEAAVRELYDRIASDVRHHTVVNVWASTADERRFPDWSMGYENLHQPQAATRSDELTAPGAATSSATTTEPARGDDPIGFVERRSRVLRRALATGDRLLAALAIILNGHAPETTPEPAAGRTYLRCRVCRPNEVEALDTYPCPTAKNAIWALEATGFR